MVEMFPELAAVTVRVCAPARVAACAPEVFPYKFVTEEQGPEAVRRSFRPIAATT